MADPRIRISPPLVNSSNPWCSTIEQLQALYDHPSTGAVITRTAPHRFGFPDDPKVHQHAFFNGSSINSYGYSPYPLKYYFESIRSIVGSGPQKKPFIISVTGDKLEVDLLYTDICDFAKQTGIHVLCEINLSCPNIPSKPPPAYDSSAIQIYLKRLETLRFSSVPIGIKVPPYTYHGQFVELMSAIEAFPNVISFISATNTLGNSLFYGSGDPLQPVISSADGSGLGGLAGESIHALSLGNVFSIRKLLDESKIEGIKDIVIVGIGGVSDAAGFARMIKAGAEVVGVGTAFGSQGLNIFERILGERECPKLFEYRGLRDDNSKIVNEE